MNQTVISSRAPTGFWQAIQLALFPIALLGFAAMVAFSLIVRLIGVKILAVSFLK